MSEDKVKTDDVQNKVAISPEDCQNVRNYCTHFGVELPEHLERALKNFENNVCFENQNDIKLELCKWMLGSQHESFKDSMWEAPKKAAEEVVFDLQFDKDVNEALNSAVSEETKSN